jgi:hypothetical protein
MGRLTPLFVSRVSKPGKYRTATTSISSSPGRTRRTGRIGTRFRREAALARVGLVPERVARRGSAKARRGRGCWSKGDRNTPASISCRAKRVERNGAQIGRFESQGADVPRVRREGTSRAMAPSGVRSTAINGRRRCSATPIRLSVICRSFEIRPSPHIRITRADLDRKAGNVEPRPAVALRTIIAKNVDINDREFRNPPN